MAFAVGIFFVCLGADESSLNMSDLDHFGGHNRCLSRL